MTLKNSAYISLILSASVLFSAASFAATYRYINDEEQTVITSTLNHTAQKNGYEILNNQGLVSKSVPPALTAEELEEMSHNKFSAEQQQKQDANLLKLYSEPGDVDRALDRRLAQFDQVKRNVNFKITDLNHQRKSLEGEAARLERSGVEASKEITDTLKDINDQINDYQLELNRIDLDKEKAIIDAGYQKKRLKQLLHIED